MEAIQLVRFRVKEGVSDKDFRAINERFQREVAPTLPGLVRREGTVGENGEWVLVLRYTSIEAAKAAGGSDHAEVSQKLISMIDMSSMSATFYNIVSEG